MVTPRGVTTPQPHNPRTSEALANPKGLTGFKELAGLPLGLRFDPRNDFGEAPLFEPRNAYGEAPLFYFI